MKSLNSILLMSFFLLSGSFIAFAQEEETVVEKEKSFRQLFTETGYHMEFKNYNLALHAYLQLDSIEPDNANIQYRIGICYLNSSSEKSKAIPYLEKAVSHTSRAYDDLAYTERNAPQNAFFMLAKAYHLNNNLDTAIATFKKYQSLLHKKHYLQEEISRQIAMCEYAITRMEEPINVEITNLGEGVNTEYSDFCPVINADETMMIFTSRRKGSTGGGRELDGRYFEDIYISYNDTGAWSLPKKIGASINTSEHEAAIGLSADGQRLFIYKDDEGDGNIYQSYLMGDVWTVPDKMNENINSEGWETHATITPDGRRLYFVSDRKKGGFGGRDIYMCKKLPSGEWAEAQNLGEVINTKYDEDAPFIHPDGRTLFFSSNGHKTMGGFDIFFSERQGRDSWTVPINIGYPINTTDDDIFYVESSDGKRAYFSSVRPEGFGDIDIYRAFLLDKEEIALTVLKGIMAVTNDAGEPLDAQILVVDNKTGDEFYYKPNSKTGKYIIILTPGKNYTVNYEINDSVIRTERLFIPQESAYQEINMAVGLKTINADGSIVDEARITKKKTHVKDTAGTIVEEAHITVVEEAHITVVEEAHITVVEEAHITDTAGTKENMEIVQPEKQKSNVDLSPVIERKKILLKNIFFDFNKASLRPESKTELEKLYDMLVKSPDITIEISGHTDSRGSPEINMRLSLERAQSVFNYLVNMGLDKKRLVAKGYGETMPRAINTNPDGTDNPDGRALNRRIELSLLGTNISLTKEFEIPEQLKMQESQTGAEEEKSTQPDRKD